MAKDEQLQACRMGIIDAIEAQFDIHAMDPEDWAEMSCAIDASLSAAWNHRIEPEAADRGVSEADPSYSAIKHFLSKPYDGGSDNHGS